MAYMNYSKMFSCPKCGTIGAIFLVKVAGTLIIIKQKCPKHGGRAFKVPLSQLDLYTDLLRNGVFRCYKCGQEATVDHTKTKGPWTLLKSTCPTHGSKLPFQKIYTIIYNDISGSAISAPVVVAPQPAQPQSTPKFCPHCGAPMVGMAKFCAECGAEVD